MMQNNLFINRLIIITEEGKTAYDEVFHQGVNIIHGQNSSGKSTIIRFIFFVLGGSYGDFVPEALRCQYVTAEVKINGIVYTLKRYLEKTDDGTKVKKTTPMYIYYGSIEECEKDQRSDKWQLYGYNTLSNRRSFSNVLFELMGLPEVKEGSNITIHQILRLIYLDQESPLSSLFFFEQFDQSFTRETVAELLMGLYNEQLSDAKLYRLKLKDKIEELKQNIKITRQFLDDPIKQSPAFLKEQIDHLRKEMEEISDEVKRLRESNLELESWNLNQKLEYQRLQEQVAGLRERLTSVDKDIAHLKADIQDSTYFIHALQKKIEAVDRTIATRDYFDKLHLEFCPECLQPVEGDVEVGHCRLCKAPIDNSKGKSQAMRIKLELQFQIRESQQLLDFDNDVLKSKTAERENIQRDLENAQEKYDYAVRNVRSTQDERIDELIQTKGYKEGEITQFLTLLESAEKYQRLEKELSDAEEEMGKLNHYIAAADSKIKRQRTLIERSICDNGIYLLHNDHDRQEEFRNAKSITLDYGQNIIYLDDGHTKLSASSSFYLKMAARFAFFLASVQVDTMMFPRLMLSDNMEDKGLEEDRSRNFQRILVQHLNQIEAEKHRNLEHGTLSLEPSYQVIFATSMIAPELDKTEYTVGEFYTKDNKSLKNV